MGPPFVSFLNGMWTAFDKIGALGCTSHVMQWLPWWRKTHLFVSLCMSTSVTLATWVHWASTGWLWPKVDWCLLRISFYPLVIWNPVYCNGYSCGAQISSSISNAYLDPNHRITGLALRNRLPLLCIQQYSDCSLVLFLEHCYQLSSASISAG